MPAESVQVVELKVPAAFVLKVTMPVGVTAPAPEASVTVAVQVVDWSTVTDAGAHETVVEDALMFEVTVNDPLLPVWTLSPP